MLIRLFCVLLLYQCLAFAFPIDSSSIYPNQYDYGDRIDLFVTGLRSSLHPNEQQDYYRLPFCELNDKHDNDGAVYGIGNILNGDRISKTDYVVLMQINRQHVLLCERRVRKEDVRAFETAIRAGYKVQMLLDNLPNLHVLALSDTRHLHGFQEYELGHDIGYIDSNETAWLYTHLDIEVDYRGLRVVGFRTQPDNEIELATATVNNVSWTYSVKWRKGSSDQKWTTRWDIYAEFNREPSSVYIYSIILSLLAILVTALLIVCSIRRKVLAQVGFQNLAAVIESIKKEGSVIRIQRRSRPSISSDDPEREPGWRLVRYDVFRAPQHTLFFVALISTGLQLLSALLSTILFAYLGVMYIGQRGNLLTAIIVFYFMSSAVNGYSSGRLFRKLCSRCNEENTRPISNFLMSYLLYPALLTAIVLPLNAYLDYEESSATISWNWLVILAACWFSVSFFLSSGSYYISVRKRAASYPIRTNTIPRVIPRYSIPWSTLSILMSGGLSFLTVLLPLSFIYRSVWGSAFSGMYTLLCASLLLWLFATSCFSLLIVFIQLNLEDWHWWWTSWLSGASISLYILFYSLYYYVSNTVITGSVSTIIYFGYVLLIASFISLIAGSISTLFCMYFLFYIYRLVKVDE